ncbi:MAG TPA: hypothetical protein VFP72_00440 [Kineosporiaceae bacterium]|nr:hypothetical protein [Kineosporiaceae bacterium]
MARKLTHVIAALIAATGLITGIALQAQHHTATTRATGGCCMKI